MQLRFTYTLEELAEAVVPPGTTARALQSPLKTMRDVALWLAVILLASLLYFVTRSVTAPQQPPVDLVMALASAGLPTLLVVALLISVQAQTMRGSWQVRRRRITVMRHVASIIILSGMLLAVLAVLKGGPMIWHASRGAALLVTLMPGVIALFFLILAGRLLPRNQLLRQWESGVFITPKTVELTSDSISFSDSAGDLHCRWSFFQHARETRNLLLLIARDERIFFIPKRAFADPLEVAAAKAIIQTNIPQAEFLAPQSAFPVAAGGRGG
jgi:hypothetical protein